MDNKLKELRKWRKYNYLLYSNLQQFFTKNKALIESKNYVDKRAFLIKLKDSLDSAAVMRQDTPKQFVPLKMVYAKLYSDLFESRVINKSYLDLLDIHLSGGNVTEKKLQKKEQKILKDMNKKIRKISNFESMIPPTLRTEIMPSLRNTINSMTQPQTYVLNPITNMMSAFLIVCILFSSVVAAANEPFVGNESKLAKTMQMVQKVAEFERSHMTNRYTLGITNEDGELNIDKFNEHLELMRNASKWLEEIKLIDYELWGTFMEKGFHNAVRSLRTDLQKKLDAYSYGEYYVYTDSSKFKWNKRTMEKVSSSGDTTEWDIGFNIIGAKGTIIKLKHDVTIMQETDNVARLRSKGANFSMFIDIKIDIQGRLIFIVNEEIETDSFDTDKDTHVQMEQTKNTARLMIEHSELQFPK